MAEFALILPILLLLTLGVVDFSRLFISYIALTNTVREGALYAAQGNRDDAPVYVGRIRTRMENEAVAGGLNWADVAAVTVADTLCTTSTTVATATWTTCANFATPTFVRVWATYQMDLIVPLFGSFTMRSATVAPAIK